MVVQYQIPERWIKYDAEALFSALVEAKASVLSLKSIPYQRSWAEALQNVQLKQEVAGTSRIEGAEFTEHELDLALLDEAPEEAMTRSQRQARAAVNTYRWIARLEDDHPITDKLIREVHRRIVTGCDDDHCPPGQLRGDGENVIFGTPRHRGVEGGSECESAFQKLCDAVQAEFRNHDILIQALALHYHLGAMHPFLDGNGRTARALEALMLQRSGLRDELFIALSNYYYDEKLTYLSSLSTSRAKNHNLTEFLLFGLQGISLQCNRLMKEIRTHVQKAIFRDVANDLFNRLQSKKKRVIAKRQVEILNCMLDRDDSNLQSLFALVSGSYANLKSPWKAFIRDVIYLLNLKAIRVLSDSQGEELTLCIRLEWATEVTETSFFEAVQQMPKAKTYRFLQKHEQEDQEAQLDLI